ncbi:MAG: sigma-54-dependent Fis family transcriptional regulator, partial [Desulfobacterales bacterium]|nr:sigma-54-dependent Fis family transcriptional regulator [Desulfobacterales bacterium]
MTDQAKLLIVDDELSMREFLEIMLGKEGYRVASAETGKKANALLDQETFDLALCDIRLGDISGLDVLRKAKAVNPDTVVIMISAYATAENAVEAMNEGAYDYVPKPFDNDELKQTISKALELKTLSDEKKRLDDELRQSLYFGLLVGNSPRMKHIYELIEQVAPTKTSVMITGESGTGKELIARAIHDQSNRSDKPFVVINCGSIPETLMESEFFGYKKGAFTGANRDKFPL